MISRVFIFVYGLLCYLMFLGVFLYALAFVGGLPVPRTIDGPAVGAGPWPLALAVNLSLVLAFGLQHSIMARPTFKRWWARFVPDPAERSTYVLMSNLCLIALFVLWQPLSAVAWDVRHPLGRAALWALFGAGWSLVLVTTLLINHFDLFGLRQVWLHLRGREYAAPGFVTPAFYRQVRHPLYVGWLMAFWATPTMTVGHLLFAVGTSAYIFVAISFEERNLLEAYGEAYRAYRERTPMLIPRLPARRSKREAGAGAATAARA